MSPKLIRLLFVAMLAAGFSAPMLVAGAASGSGVDVHDPDKGGFVAPHAEPPNRLEIGVGGTVTWTVWEGTHNVTPKDGKQWGSGSPELTQTSERYSKQFKSAGDYFYFCSIHSSADDVGKAGVGMWGLIHVFDPTPDTTAPPSTQTTAPPTTQPTAPPTTATTRPGATPPATSATAPTTRPTPTTAAPAPTTTTAKPDKKKDAKDEETTTTSSTLPPPVDLPNEAIVPTLPGLGAAPGSDAEAPIDTPEGEAVALLKSKKNNGGDAVKLLIVSGLGLGALGVGTAGYKYANRSSKYFPA